MSDSLLRLRAQDADDLQVVSALLQDAIIPGGDMQFDRDNQRFVAVANRFCWEQSPLDGVTSEAGEPVYQRSLCGITIAHVERVLATKIPQDKSGLLLNLLVISPATHDGYAAIDLLFSGGAAMRLISSQIDLVVEDIEMARPSMRQPDHGDS